VIGKLAGVNDNLAARRVFDRVRNQILEDALQETGEG
jgi:hypothetical protein